MVAGLLVGLPSEGRAEDPLAESFLDFIAAVDLVVTSEAGSCFGESVGPGPILARVAKVFAAPPDLSRPEARLQQVYLQTRLRGLAGCIVEGTDAGTTRYELVLDVGAETTRRAPAAGVPEAVVSCVDGVRTALTFGAEEGPTTVNLTVTVLVGPAMRSKDAIDKVVKDDLKTLQRCYQAALSEDASVSGTPVRVPGSGSRRSLR